MASNGVDPIDQRIEKYRSQALVCEVRARLAEDPDAKLTLMQAAASWRELAEGLKLLKKLRPPGAIAGVLTDRAAGQM